MKTEILISCDDWENRVAVLEEGSLAEIYFEREEKVIGSIYKGRVENVLPGMGACFVNIGLGRNAFLYVDDILRDPINIGETEITDRRKGHTVNELLKVGSEVLVQIVKEPRGLKGARVSTNISLPGRYLVLMPTGRYSGVSSRIEDPNERARLKQIMRRVRPEGMATIVRTAAGGVSEAELIADLGVQLRLWHGILESYKRSSAPALLHKDLNLVFKAVRDFLTSDVTAVYIDSKEQYDEIRSTMSLLGPQYINRLKLVDGPGSLFEQRGIDAELQKLLKPKIPLPSGGHLVLEHTEALTVIDVNTGKFTGGRNLEDTIVKTNIEAAAEIARQVRLRDIGGIIVVDFIDMTHERSREQVIATLTEALHRDRTRSTIQAFSKLGLLEFTRKRVGKDLAGQLRSDCPYCSGLGNVMSSETVAIGVLRQMRERLEQRNGGSHKLDVVADPGVATQLLGWYHDEFQKLARDHDAEVAFYVDTQRHREQVVVEDARRMRAAPVIGSVIEADLLPVRLPNPASGVAEVNGYLIEVKDAANATGQTVKLKVDAVDGNLVRASLAEPLAGAARRRRRDRGRVKGVSAAEAPIAPPTPLPHPAAAEDGRRHAEERREPAPRRKLADVAFSIEDEEEETVPRVTVQRSASARTERGGEKRRDGGRRRGGRRTGSQEHQPLVVGGEGDIDYDDGDDDSVEVTGSVPRPRQVLPEAENGVGHKRRRRRGRGKGRTPAEHGRATGREEGEPYEDDDLSLAPAGASYDEGEASDDDLESVVDPRRPAASASTREPRRFGPIRQLYGRPVQVDERSSRERSRRDEPPARDRNARTARRPERSRAPSDEDLDVVIQPKGPSSVRVRVQDVEQRERPPRYERERPERREREDRGERHDREHRGERFERTERTERERTERPDRRERREPREDRPRGRGGRSAPPRVKREGPAVKQLYPPPDWEAEEAPPAEDGKKPVKGFGRPTRGPLMRPADAAPVPKGKVRQLYPPPPEGGEAPSSRAPVSVESTETYEPVAFDEAGDENDGSVFVSDEQELDERRRRARDRAEARRRAQDGPGSDLGESGTPFRTGPNENDEWPVF